MGMKISSKILSSIFSAVCVIFLYSTTAISAVEPKQIPLLSFNEWKTQTRQEIQKKISSLESKMAKPTDEASKTQMKAQLRSEKMKLEASEDLTFHEYFLSYLAEQKDLAKRISELSKTLKPEEIRDLINSYGDLINKRKDDDKQGYNTLPLDD